MHCGLTEDAVECNMIVEANNVAFACREKCQETLGTTKRSNELRQLESG